MHDYSFCYISCTHNYRHYLYFVLFIYLVYLNISVVDGLFTLLRLLKNNKLPDFANRNPSTPQHFFLVQRMSQAGDFFYRQLHVLVITDQWNMSESKTRKRWNSWHGAGTKLENWDLGGWISYGRIILVYKKS